MFIHVAWDVGHIEVGIGLVRELLELGIERFLSEMSVLELVATSNLVRTYPSK